MKNILLFWRAIALMAAMLLTALPLGAQQTVKESPRSKGEHTTTVVTQLQTRTAKAPALAPPYNEGRVTETFDDESVFEPFSVGGITDRIHWGQLGNFLVHDATGGELTTGIYGLKFPNEFSPKGFMVMNMEKATQEQSAYEYAPYSGNQYLTSLCAAEGRTDHWLISPPVVGGNSNVISFYYRVDYSLDPETYEILYSTTDTKIESFKPHLSYEINNEDWKRKDFVIPSGAKYFAIRHTSDNQRGIMIDDLSFVAAAVKDYGIKIGGVAVTSANYQNISASGGFPAVKSGSVKFDPNTFTLALSQVQIESGSDYGIYFESSSRASQLVLEGASKIACSAFCALGTSVPLVIKGDGSVATSSDRRNSYGILVSNRTSLTIGSGITIEAKGTNIAIGANNGYEKLTIEEGATVTAISSGSCISGFGSIILEGNTHVIKPEGAVVSGGSVKFNDQVCSGEVIIAPAPAENYGIRIGGVEVTSDNYLNITPEGGFPVVQNGTVKYSPRSRTLTLSDAVIVADSRNQIAIQFYGYGAYTLKLEGIKTEVSAYGPALRAQHLTISGKEGTFKSDTDCAIYVYSTGSEDSQSLTIDGCMITATGVWGIAGDDGRSETLTVKNATVKAQGEKGSICDLKELELIDCIIAGPKSAVWNAEMHAICNPMGEVITSMVLIEPIGTGIEGVADRSTTTQQGLFTTSGQRIKGDWNHLPRGIYIMKGKKVVKK